MFCCFEGKPSEMRSRRNNRVRRVVLVVVVLVGGGYLATNAYSGNVELKVWCDSPKTQSSVATINVGYKSGATEGFDDDDSVYLQPPQNAIGAFTEIEKNGDDPNKLSTNNKGLDSTTEYPGKVETIGNDIHGDAYWKLDITDVNDLEWKSIIFSRYGKDANLADPNCTPLATWDAKYKDGQGWFQQGYFSNTTSGICDKINFHVFNYSDLNRDKKVNFKDYAIFANNFGRTDPNCGADPNNLDDYSDLDRDGVIDFNDLSLFTGEWLWDANDPNTW